MSDSVDDGDDPLAPGGSAHGDPANGDPGGGRSMNGANGGSGSSGTFDPVDHVVFIVTPHGGLGHASGLTRGDGNAWSFADALSSLEPYRAQTNIVEGLDAFARHQREEIRPHETRPLLLTGRAGSLGTIDGYTYSIVHGGGPSIDRLIANAREFEPITLRIGDELSNESVRPFMHVAWEDRDQVAPVAIDPKEAAERAFGSLADPPSEIVAFQEGLADRGDPRADESTSWVFEDHMELVRLAFAHDTTNSATIEVGDPWWRAGFAWLTGFDPGNSGYYLLSHTAYANNRPGGGNYDQETLAWEQIQTWFAEQVAGFVRKLSETEYGDGSLLDHTLVVWTADGNPREPSAHRASEVPVVMIGNLGGRLQTGQLIDIEGRDSRYFVDLFRTIATALEVDASNFGDPELVGEPITELLSN